MRRKTQAVSEQEKSEERGGKDGDVPEKKISAEWAFIGAVLLLILVLGIIFGIRYLKKPEILTPDEMHKKNLEGKLTGAEGYVYNGFSFVKYEKLWFTQLHPQDSESIYNVQLHFGPRETEQLNILGDPMPFAKAKAVYLIFDPLGQQLPYVALAAGEFSLNTAVVLNITPIAACTRNETEICKKRPIVDCEHDKEHAIVYLKEADKAGVVVEQNCITVSGTQADLVKATDKLLLKWFQVI